MYNDYRADFLRMCTFFFDERASSFDNSQCRFCSAQVRESEQAKEGVREGTSAKVCLYVCVLSLINEAAVSTAVEFLRLFLFVFFLFSFCSSFLLFSTDPSAAFDVCVRECGREETSARVCVRARAGVCVCVCVSREGVWVRACETSKESEQSRHAHTERHVTLNRTNGHGT